MRQPLVAGNWKMNGSLKENRKLLDELVSGLNTKAEVLVCPPSVYAQSICEQLAGSAIKVGLQNVSDKTSGAYTGEVSPLMAKDLGIEYVVIGHSERRSLFNESDEEVAAKFCALTDQKLVPILCVGETLEEREAGDTMNVVTAQVEAVLRTAGPERLANFVIAYEPVWAIGTGLTATPEQAQEVHAVIRGLLAKHDQAMADRTRILYGGSMKAANAADLIALPDVDGGLVGGASLIAEEFQAICHAAG
ncbi:triose-phosphate isomerase [Endozoicomonas numazuensis]|uniref:Triosephosphate isomerase n=1 Tax=Endozoicomonas numazuensis TaxID=1137799 RepID=A0A081NES4_9GAMM|nr:triose-phosphate isomerase [Endozoicomonas numazuensis]KEQ16947.1 triosephosphate isomerase [Endozoicomonas numazuensis]